MSTIVAVFKGRPREPESINEPNAYFEAVLGKYGFVANRIYFAAVAEARKVLAYGFEGEESTEGGAVFVFQTRELRRLLPWVLSWGASARVLSPSDVAARVRREAEALARSYAEA